MLPGTTKTFAPVCGFSLTSTYQFNHPENYGNMVCSLYMVQLGECEIGPANARNVMHRVLLSLIGN